jgi:hypothetical protein
MTCDTFINGILGCTPVGNQRKSCEDPVSAGKQKHLPRGGSEDVFAIFLHRREFLFTHTGPPPFKDVYADSDIQGTSFAQNRLFRLNDYILEFQAVKKPRNMCVSC